MEITRDPAIVLEAFPDATAALERGGFVVHEPGKASFLFDRVGEGVYDVHLHVSEEYRKKGQALFREARDIVFTQTDATQLLGRPPKDRPEVRMFAVKAGFRHLFDTEDAHVYALDLLQWAVRARRYRANVDPLQAAVELPDDDLHDQFAGVAIECARHNQMPKGLWLYNQFAATAGYAPATIFSRLPPVIDFAGTQILVLGDSVEEI